MIEIDGKLYHTDDVGELILDENNNPIPLSICLCFAKTPSECWCECNSWGDYDWDEYE